MLFETGEQSFLDLETSEYRWVEADQLDGMDTVKGLKQELENVGIE